MTTKKLYSSLSAGLLIGVLALAPLLAQPVAKADTMVTVTIASYLDGQLATPASANNTSYTMNATWDAENVGSGSGQFTLGPTGFNNPTAYQATTADMSLGADYGISAVMDSTTGATCDAGETYMHAGYSYGNSLEAAAQAQISMTAPNLTDIQEDKYIIVWNHSCAAPDTATVHIAAYLDGSEATEITADEYLFPMSATWQAANVSGGVESSGTYNLGDGEDQDHLYQTNTTAFDLPAQYSTSVVTDSSSNVLPIGAACVSGKYSLEGYMTSTVSFEEAENADMQTSATFHNLFGDQYVIVSLNSCGDDSGGDSGTIGGDVTGGITPGALAVTSVTTVNGSATANGTFASGFKYVFNITVPDAEPKLAMKFSNWTNTTTSSNIIPAANNIRISSSQADNSGATVTVSAADTYTSPALNITGDMDAVAPGKQVQVTVEVAVPSTTVNGSYTTTYGVQTLP